MENIILLLTIIPTFFSLLYLINRSKRYYKVLSCIICFISIVLSVFLVIGGEQRIELTGASYQIIEAIVLVCEVLITLYLYLVSIRNKRWPVLGLTIMLTCLSIYTVFFMEKSETAYINVDKLSIVMALIVNIIGTLILLFSNAYMSHYEEHRGMKSKQRLYYFVICIFLSAMNGLIFCDSLSWVYFCWEVTTISSFVLISYNGDNEAKQSGFRALLLNLIGGVCFLAGNILLKSLMNIDSLTQIIHKGGLASVYIIPVFLLCIAGFVKSAQMPFQSWLLGAMAAPTPVSALLHSSTMVNAGVYLIVKLSPAYAGTFLGTAIAIYGSLSFLLCSIIAVTQRNAKRVLAYSTIANLGLVVSSAGMGTSIAISAAIMLIIFHAVSKALLFLCAGQIEHVIGSRDIEDMTGLIRKAPVLTIFSILGILSMILPPFGVLVTKWISIEASANNPVVIIFLVIGSAFTTVFWIKWLGSMLAYPVNELKHEDKMDFATYLPLGLLGAGILGTSIFVTPLFNLFVSPVVSKLLNSGNQLTGNYANMSSNIGSFNVGIVLLVLVIAGVIYLFVRKFILTAHIKKIYVCGENSTMSETSLRFRSGTGDYEKPVVSNLYLYDVISEKKVTTAGYVLSSIIILAVLIGGLI